MVIAACKVTPPAAEPQSPAPAPAAVPVPIAEPDPAPAVVPAPQEEPFDPANVSPALKQATLSEIQQLVESLNYIIREKNFNGWLVYLSDEARKSRNSPEFLAEQSTSPRLKGQPKLASIEDYFIRVVVPSRADYHVDDIEFISANRVKAYTINSRTQQRLILYTLEYVDGLWKITV